VPEDVLLPPAMKVRGCATNKSPSISEKAEKYVATGSVLVILPF
jgi:hypothetical protein